MVWLYVSFPLLVVLAATGALLVSWFEGGSPISIAMVDEPSPVALFLRELSDITDTILILLEGMLSRKAKLLMRFFSKKSSTVTLTVRETCTTAVVRMVIGWLPRITMYNFLEVRS